MHLGRVLDDAGGGRKGRRMTSILGVSMPKVGISKDELTSTKSIALGGIAAASLVVGGVAGAIKHKPLIGLGVGAAIAAVATGAALLGNASQSYDGVCDARYGYDPDCDTYPQHDGGYRDHDGDGAREDPLPYDPRYPGGATHHGDD